MKRRTFNGCLLATAASMPFLVRRSEAREEAFLAPTRMIDSENPTISSLADRISSRGDPPLARARAAFAYVRDQISFGFGPRFYDYRASEVVSLGIGYCNTKGTLFAALLRACGVPARQVFVDINARVLRGLIDPGTPFVDHSYVEALIDGRWIATDAYIVDRPLFTAAIARLRRENERLGYGAHVAGSTEWNAKARSFSQYVQDGSIPMSSRKFGRYTDVADFYAREPRAWNRLGGVASLFAGAAFSRANSAIAAVRAGA